MGLPPNLKVRKWNLGGKVGGRHSTSLPVRCIFAQFRYPILQFSSEMKEIRIKHDMSKEDRQKEYELRQEARQKQMDDTD